MTKKDEVALENALESVKGFYNGLSANAKKKTAVISLIGDMKDHNNYDIVVGSHSDLVMTLAQAMLGRQDFFAVVKDSVTLLETYIKREEEESKKKKKDKDKNKTIVS